MRKLGLSLVLAGILGATSAVAEESGAFVGVQLGYGGMKAKAEVEQTVAGETFKESDSISLSGFRYGILGGYKQFFTPNFGARYYAVVDLGTDYKKDENKISTFNITANADALYNFLSNDDLDFGVFAGLSLGYANHKLKDTGAFDVKPSGFDLGINFGLRTNIATNHGIELYSRFGLLQQKDDITVPGDDMSDKMTFKVSQPYAVGLRYTFSF